MILRIESRDGTKRVEVEPRESVSRLISKVQDTFSLPPSYAWNLCRSRNGMDPLYNSDAPISSQNLKHGDRLFLTFPSSASTGDSGRSAASWESGAASKSAAGSSATATDGTQDATASEEDEIDKILSKADGSIERKRDPQLCRHGDQGRCIHCTPIQPFDPEHLAKLEIKHMSFHAYLRKLHSGVDKGKFLFLENLSCKLKPGCTEHAPWPNGICTKCQPNAVTLKRQEYRHVDNIMFEDRSIIEGFLGFWRATGLQRLGILYGKFAEHKDVPLGIKAVVSAIYEPPQENTPNSVRLLPDKNEQRVRQLGELLGLRPVGWVFCDLESEDRSKGTVKYFRHLDTYFLSAEECIMAAEFQVANPSPCKFSSTGHFGSKFCTVVVSGGADSQICMEGYQVTDQCMALVRDDCFVPTVDAPELGYIRESTNEQYVPDVFYKRKDQYGSEVTKMARPLPVEYLLVQIPVAAPVIPNPMFQPNEVASKLREAVDEVQRFRVFCKYVRENQSNFLPAVSNFHVLCFMACCDMLPIRDTLGILCDAVVRQDATLAEQWRQSPEWATVLHMIEDEPVQGGMDIPDGVASDSASRSSSNSPPNGLGSASTWQCQHCTFLNQRGVTTCDMCGLPQS